MRENTSNKVDRIIESETLHQEESKGFYIYKAIAILCVIAAHVSVIIENLGIWTFICSTFWAMMARIGVVIFFTTSGFFFSRTKGDSLNFWKKKFFNIIIPWLICATATFLLVVLTGDKSNIAVRYIQWIFGFSSWFYYIVVLLILFLIFPLIEKSESCLYICFILNIISIFLETWKINPISNICFLSPWLNIFNWIGYFALGILCRKHRLDRWILKSKITLIVTIVLTIFAIVLFFLLKNENEFHFITFFYKLPLMAMLFYVSSWLAKGKMNFMVVVGKDTYFIYLVHMQIVQFICSRLPIIFEIVKPLLGLLIMCILALAIKVFFKKILKWEAPLKLIGLK